MRVSRIRPEDRSAQGHCDACRDKGIIEVALSPDRPVIRFCRRCARYLGDFIDRRLAEHDQGMPIPPRRMAGRGDNWGNR